MPTFDARLREAQKLETFGDADEAHENTGLLALAGCD
jgi:hypothetical protein